MQSSLRGLTLIELRELLKSVNRSILDLEKEVGRQAATRVDMNTKPQARKSRVIPKVAVRTSDDGGSFSLASSGIPETESKAPSIKYMHPVNRNWVWDGQGDEPDWIRAYMDRGGSWDALENTAAIFEQKRRGSNFRWS